MASDVLTTQYPREARLRGEHASILELKDVTVAYDAVVALDGASLTFWDENITVIMGPNGAGKTTVLKAILGLAPVIAGEIYWQGLPLHAATYELLSLGIALVPQGRRVFPSLTVQENLEIGCLHIKNEAEKNLRMRAMLELFGGLREKRYNLAGQLSGGQQQMLAIGRALMATPKVLLLDEPTLGLSPRVVGDVFAKVMEVKQKTGTAVVMVEHNVKSALDIADYVYVVDKGKVVFAGTPDALRQTDILTKVFLGAPVM